MLLGRRGGRGRGRRGEHGLDAVPPLDGLFYAAGLQVPRAVDIVLLAENKEERK